MPRSYSGESAQREIITSSKTFIPPINVSLVSVTLVGGGGGGAGGSSGARGGGGGGAGGFVTNYVLYLSASEETNITIGAGGSGGGYLSDGTAGGSTIFGNKILVGGGRGGISATGVGGDGGVAPASLIPSGTVRGGYGGGQFGITMEAGQLYQITGGWERSTSGSIFTCSGPGGGQGPASTTHTTTEQLQSYQGGRPLHSFWSPGSGYPTIMGGQGAASHLGSGGTGGPSTGQSGVLFGGGGGGGAGASFGGYGGGNGSPGACIIRWEI